MEYPYFWKHPYTRQKCRNRAWYFNLEFLICTCRSWLVDRRLTSELTGDIAGGTWGNGHPPNFGLTKIEGKSFFEFGEMGWVCGYAPTDAILFGGVLGIALTRGPNVCVFNSFWRCLMEIFMANPETPRKGYLENRHSS